jgi:Pentapeptide repeats (9 copies)
VLSFLKAYLEQDFARPLRDTVFEWWLTHGFATWLLDGLDEVIAQDESFFDYLLHLLTLPAGANPPILICVRDSLLATSKPLQEFVEDYPYSVRTYRLEKWGTPSKAAYSQMRLGQSSQAYLAEIRAKPGLDELASIPYYSELLTEIYAESDLRELLTEADLLDLAVSSMIKREYKKQLLDERVIKEADVLQFAQAVAAEDMEAGFQGVSVSDASELAQGILSSDVPGWKSYVPQMTQLALFSAGATGQIRFTQELIEHYLLGQWFIELFEDRPNSLLRYFDSRAVPYDSIAFKVFAEHVRTRDAQQRLVDFVHQVGHLPQAFKNGVQLLATVAQGGSLPELHVEHHDLSGLTFSALSLGGVSFVGCDLTDAQFDSCNLSGANFQEAVLKNTGFVNGRDDFLRDAQFGDLSRFFSIRVDSGRLLDEPATASQWLAAKVGRPLEVVSACQAALQLRHLFGKFVRPNGEYRRKDIDRNGAVAGKRFTDPEVVLEAALQNGYLLVEERSSGRRRIGRPAGGKYSEMMEYVKGFALSPGLRSLLSQLCLVTDCAHVPRQVRSGA